MKAEIVATGTELLLGEITDINSPYLADQLSRLGIDLYWISIVGDNLGRLTEAFERAWRRSDLVITTGGLGPTQGDITRNAIALMLGEELSVDTGEEQRLRDFFASRRMEMPQSNIRQATSVPSARFLPNPLGTAPGWWIEKSEHILITLPGPPEELHQLWENECVPRLRQKLGGVVILSRVLKTFGISEAKLGELLSDLAKSYNPTLATYAKPDGIHIRITAKSDSESEAREMVGGFEQEVRQIAGTSVWGTDLETLHDVVGRLLREQLLTISTMESCTGGLLATTLTSVPGCSAYYKGGIVSYSNDVKVASGVDSSLVDLHGAVSSQVADSMARAIRDRFEVDIGVSITGVAGPASLEGKPPGTVFIGIDDRGRRRVTSRTLPGNRQRVRERATMLALFEIRNTLLGR